VSTTDRCARFRELHREGTFLMPNPWDVGSARLLASLGFDALATTSAGLAWSIGKDDQAVTRDELVAHVRLLAESVDVPLAVDSERLYADTMAGVGETVRMLAEAGAAGCSIEDYDPATGRIDEVGLAAERVAAAATAARETGLVLTARAENHFYGGTDLDDTIERLLAYRAAGADVLYAPHLIDPAEIRTLIGAVDAPVNVLALEGGPTVAELAELGARRISTGGSLARAAYGALLAGARELLATGTSDYLRCGLTPADRAAFEPRDHDPTSRGGTQHA
jgi:2-methylisocitrate lyase-like PEP mutase family enzyme